MVAEEAGKGEGDPIEGLTARLRRAAQEPFSLSQDEIGALLAEAADVIERLDNLVQAQAMASPTAPMIL